MQAAVSAYLMSYQGSSPTSSRKSSVGQGTSTVSVLPSLIPFKLKSALKNTEIV